MSKLFGIDIASTVADAFKGNLRPVTLTRVTHSGEYNPETAKYEDGNGNVVQPQENEYTSEGIVESYSDSMKAAGLADENHRRILVLAQPLGVTPKSGDKIDIDGSEYTVTGVPERDPAGATFIIKGEL